MIHTTPELMKFKRLQRRLRESTRGTVGLLEMLWMGTAKNAPRGDIGRLSNEEIAIMTDWDLDPDELVFALVESGWLDECLEHRLLVHDWQQHCPKWVKGVIARTSNFATLSPVPRVSDHKYHDPGLATLRPLPPNLTQPNLIVLSSKEERLSDDPRSATQGRGRQKKYKPDFESWYKIYPIHKSKEAAAKAYPKAVASVSKSKSITPEEANQFLVDAASRFAESVAGEDPKFIKHPSTWLNQGCWDDEQVVQQKQSRVATAEDLANWRP